MTGSLTPPTPGDAAVREWAPLAYYVASRFRLPGADRDDVRQEALIALWHALRSYDGSGTLRGHLSLCIHRRLSSKLRDALRPRHAMLTDAARDEPIEAPHVGVGGPLPLDVLTTAERRACVGVALGLEYLEIGPPKSVDNALQRARRKLRAA